MGEPWFAEHWFDLLQAVGIIGSFWVAIIALRSEAKTRRIANLLTITTNHREIWKEFLNNPELERVRDRAADTAKQPVTDTERMFVTFVILHISSVHSASRRSLERSSFRRKMLAYQATWAQNLHRQFGWQRFRVLTVTTDSGRVREMIEVCQRLKSGLGLFLFTDGETLREQSNFFSLRWQTARGGEMVSLFD